jgi:hypothetical protein
MRTHRKHTVWVAVIAAVAIAAPFTARSRGGVTGSPHDLSRLGFSREQTCLPCHGTHETIVRDANGQRVGAPLWNHTISTATYKLYVDPITGQQINGQIDATSRMCLSCHDGTIALDSFGGGGFGGGGFGGGGNGTQLIAANANLGIDLSNDHPIGQAAIWPTVTSGDLVDQRLRDSAGIMPLPTLPDGRRSVGCISCHEPHNARALPAMLWTSINGPGTTVDGRSVNGSLLCMNCHKMGDTTASRASRR